MNLTVTTPAADTPVSLDDAKRQLFMEGTTDADALIGAHIKAAVAHVETSLGRALVTRIYTATLDCWMNCIWLKMPPIGEVSSIKYDDLDGVEQTLAPSVYEVGERFGQAYVKLAPNQSWPVLDDSSSLNRIRIAYTAGYGDVDAVPDDIKHGILLLVTHYFENRGTVNIGNIVSEIPQSVDALLTPYRVWELA
ncbi:head-tail connector protein [Kiloniella majae]|uniref:head-tail connector protein n=1 Tax=Kiloniella majae TaxID=1938558 RepID=UPI000A2798F1|nr:head-tail connector protein [Kiloniella majae]